MEKSAAKLISLCVSCWFLSWSSAFGAQAKEVGELTYPELPRFEVPEPVRVELDNGMVVMLLEDHELPLVSVVARVRTGARLEPPEKIGLASLTGIVIRTGGTERMSSDELDDFLETRAADVSTAVGMSFGSASMNCLSEDFPTVFPVFGEVLRRPAFDENRLRVAVNQLTAGIARQNDDPSEIMEREFDQIVYGEDSPYARTPTYATVGSVTRDDLVAWHARYYHPNHIILGLIGDFKTQEALRLVRETFGDWRRGPLLEKTEVSYRKEVDPGVYYVEKNDVTQSYIKMGHLGITRDNPDFFAVQVLNQVLSGSAASRLYANVRSKKGLAYAVAGGVGSNWDFPGTFSMWMTTKTETTGAGVEALLEEAGNLTADPPTQEEVAKAKTSILNSFIFNIDTRGKILGQQLTYVYYGYPSDWLARYREGIEKVTVEQVREVAAKYIDPDRFAILVVGPAEGRDQPLTKYGTVTPVEIALPEP